jgi:Domain of unknown function (DUF4419)
MPVTIYPAGVQASSVQPSFSNRPFSNSRALLEIACESEAGHLESNARIYQTSFQETALQNVGFSANMNGFVRAAIEAYSEHFHLVIRPEDVWFSILTQLCLYVNKNAEALREVFVGHEEKKLLTVIMKETLQTINFGDFSEAMSSLLQSNIKKERIRGWFLPNFSTTTEIDRVVASVIMMGTFNE